MVCSFPLHCKQLKWQSEQFSTPESYFLSGHVHWGKFVLFPLHFVHMSLAVEHSKHWLLHSCFKEMDQINEFKYFRRLFLKKRRKEWNITWAIRSIIKVSTYARAVRRKVSFVSTRETRCAVRASRAFCRTLQAILPLPLRIVSIFTITCSIRFNFKRTISYCADVVGFFMITASTTTAESNISIIIAFEAIARSIFAD